MDNTVKPAAMERTRLALAVVWRQFPELSAELVPEDVAQLAEECLSEAREAGVDLFAGPPWSTRTERADG